MDAVQIELDGNLNGAKKNFQRRERINKRGQNFLARILYHEISMIGIEAGKNLKKRLGDSATIRMEDYIQVMDSL